MPASPETANNWEIATTIDPHLEAMAAVYDLHVEVDESAVQQSLPHLQLPGTEPAPLKVKANLLKGSFKDVYDARRVSFEDDSEGSEIDIYYSQRDVKQRRYPGIRRKKDQEHNNEIVLPAIREAINMRNRGLRQEVRKYDNRRGWQALAKCFLGVGIPTAGTVLGLHEIGETAQVSQDVTEAAQILGGMSVFIASGVATVWYGIPLSQKAELRRSPYQKQGETAPADLPAIIQFKPLAATK